MYRYISAIYFQKSGENFKGAKNKSKEIHNGRDEVPNIYGGLYFYERRKEKKQVYIVSAISLLYT